MTGGGGAGGRGPGGEWRLEWRRAIGHHRRLLAAGLAAGSVAAGLSALAPAPPPSAALLVAADDLAAGRALSRVDVRTVRYPRDGVPDGALTSPEQVAGRILAAPARRGEPLTDVRFVGPSLLAGQDGRLVATPLRVADPAVPGLLRAGDVVDVLAAETTLGDGVAGVAATRTVARAVRVLAVPAPAGSAGLAEGGLVVLATTPAVAEDLARAAVTARLAITLRAG